MATRPIKTEVLPFFPEQPVFPPVSNEYGTSFCESFDRLLDKGVLTSNPGGQLCCPTCNPYILASVDTFLGYLEGLGVSTLNCCINVHAATETYLKFNKGIEGPQQPCETDFQACIDKIHTLLGQVCCDRLEEKGIVEYSTIGTDGKSQLCVLLDFMMQVYPAMTAADICNCLDRILDKGLVVACIADKTFVGSVEAYVKLTTLP